MVRWLIIFTLLMGMSNGIPNANNTHKYVNKIGDKCFTPFKLPGVCVHIQKCPEIIPTFNKIKYDKSAETYISRSRCIENQLFFCCAEANLQPPNKLMKVKNYKYKLKTNSILPTPPECGKSPTILASRIIGGVRSKKNSWPWIALLGYKVAKIPEMLWYCGGALANERYIITAAHCIITKQLGLKIMAVRLGENDLKKKSDLMMEFGIASTICHPGFDMDSRHNDIGLVMLDNPVRYSSFIQPICLPSGLELTNDSFINNAPYVAGWGSIYEGGPTSKKLREVRVPIVEHQYCEDVYKTEGATVIDKQICAGYEKGGKDSCQGDSGGPLMLLIEGFFYIIGVVSYGYGCAQPGFPSIYTRVTSYYDWLEGHLTTEKYIYK